MIGTTEWVECKEKAMGIIADWLWVLAIIIGEITGVIQGEGIGLLYQEKIVELEKLKYMKVFIEKPSIYNRIGIKDYQTLKRYTPIRVYSFY